VEEVAEVDADEPAVAASPASTGDDDRPVRASGFRLGPIQIVSILCGVALGFATVVYGRRTAGAHR